MQCFECTKAGRPEQAVALCPRCQASLCLNHLRQAVTYSDGTTWMRCPHDAWNNAPAAGRPT